MSKSDLTRQDKAGLALVEKLWPVLQLPEAADPDIVFRTLMSMALTIYAEVKGLPSEAGVFINSQVTSAVKRAEADWLERH